MTPLARAAAKPLTCLLALAFVLAACAPEPRVPDAPAAASAPDRDGAAAPAPAAADTGASSAAGATAGSATAGLVFAVAPDPDSPRSTDLWRARLADGAVQPLIQTADRNEDQPEWSERAAELVFEARPLRDVENVRRGLVLWKAGSESALPGGRARRELWAAWAPLDTRLVYSVRRFQTPGGDDPIRNGIAVLDVVTGEQTILAGATARGERYQRPAFAPDGRRVAAEYRTRQPRATRIVLLDGQGEPQILTGEDYRAFHPHFTRDGRHLLFSRRDARGAPRDVMRVALDGSAPQPLANTPESDDYLPAASPTRDEIAFLSDRDGKLDVFLVDLTGGPPRNLTAGLDFRVRKLRWSPDGERLALTAFPYDRSAAPDDQPGATRSAARVLVIDRQGRPLFQTAGFAPDWMPPWSG